MSDQQQNQQPEKPEGNNLKDKFDIYSTPVIYILDKDKKIKAKRLSADQVIDMLKILESIDKINEKK